MAEDKDDYSGEEEEELRAKNQVSPIPERSCTEFLLTLQGGYKSEGESCLRYS